MATAQNDDDCFACRVVSGGGLIGISAYVVWSAWKGANVRRGHRLVAVVFASGLASLGIARINGWRLPSQSNDDDDNSSNSNTKTKNDIK